MALAISNKRKWAPRFMGHFQGSKVTRTTSLPLLLPLYIYIPCAQNISYVNNKDSSQIIFWSNVLFHVNATREENPFNFLTARSKYFVNNRLHRLECSENTTKLKDPSREMKQEQTERNSSYLEKVGLKFQGHNFLRARGLSRPNKLRFLFLKLGLICQKF